MDETIGDIEFIIDHFNELDIMIMKLAQRHMDCSVICFCGLADAMNTLSDELNGLMEQAAQAALDD